MLTESIKGQAALATAEEEKMDEMVNHILPKYYVDMIDNIVDETLADIVLVKKNEMEEWQRKQETLKYELNMNKKKVE